MRLEFNPPPEELQVNFADDFGDAGGHIFDNHPCKPHPVSPPPENSQATLTIALATLLHTLLIILQELIAAHDAI